MSSPSDKTKILIKYLNKFDFNLNQKDKITFADVAGAKEAKEELSEIVDFLKIQKSFWK